MLANNQRLPQRESLGKLVLAFTAVFVTFSTPVEWMHGILADGRHYCERLLIAGVV